MGYRQQSGETHSRRLYSEQSNASFSSDEGRPKENGLCIANNAALFVIQKEWGARK